MGNSTNCLCDNQADTRPQTTQLKLTVYGDYYNADTRTLLAILKLANEPHDYVNLNTLANEHKEAKSVYYNVNPSGQIPTMLEGSYKILGGNNAQITYLCSTHKKIGDLLCPAESQRQIMMHLNWF